MSTNNAVNNGNLYSAGDGKILIARATGQAIAANIIGGTGISVTNGANTISISSSGANNIVDQTTGSVTMSVNTVYITDNGASLVTYTLPASAALGDYFEIVGKSSGGWTIAQNGGQTIHFGAVNTTTGAGGSLSSANQFDCIKIRCTTANTDFTVVTSQGNITYV